MKNTIKLIIIAILPLFIVFSCSSTKTVVATKVQSVSAYGKLNNTQVILSKPNFIVLGSYTGTSSLRKDYSTTTTAVNDFSGRVVQRGSKDDITINYVGPVAEARLNLWDNAKKNGVDISGSVALMNVEISKVEDGVNANVTISADIIKFYAGSNAPTNIQSTNNFSNDNIQSENATIENNKPTPSENSSERTEKKSTEEKEKNNPLNKVSNLFSKDKNTETTKEEKAPVQKIEYTSCTQCNGSGEMTKTCTKDGCKNGKLTTTCSYCNGDFAEATNECYMCNGDGCDYCNYDGKACDACKSGKKTDKHNHCDGTGKLEAECTKCAGTGKTKK